MEHERDDANALVADLEGEVCVMKRRIDRVIYACRSAFDRMRYRIFYYPIEDGLTRRSISRVQVTSICDQEYAEAVYRGMRRE